MNVKADALPLDGPLDGGVEGAAVVIEPLIAGQGHFPSALLERSSKRFPRLRALGLGTRREDYVTIPVPAFLVHHPGAGTILVDTGLHPSVAADPKQNLGRMLAKSFTLEHGHDVASQLRDRDLDPRKVSTVILTHLHHDHSSAISEFPDSTFVVSAPEWQAALNPGRFPPMYLPKHYDFAFDFRTVDFDGPDVDSYGPLGRTFDLFGDGSIRLAFTPGHSAGHISVVLRLPERDFVVGGDVAYTWRQLEGGPGQALAQDQHNWERSLHEVQRYRRAYPYAIVCPGHDAEFYEKLDARYEK